MNQTPTMETQSVSFIGKLSPILRYAEIISLVVSVIGVSLFYLSDSPTAQQLIMPGLSALAAVYYLYAFMMPPPDSEPGIASDSTLPPKGLDALPTMIRKVAYIACAVGLIGLLFGLLNLTGSNEMLMIGCSALCLSLFLSGVLILRNSANLTLLRGPLQRGLPILVLASYWLYSHRQ